MIIYIMWTVAGIVVFWHLYGAALASWHIAKSESFTPWQKTAQYLIAWLLPFVGVALILHMLGSDVRRRGPGWFPLLEPLVLASFGRSAEEAIDSVVSTEADSDSSSSEGATNGSD